MSRRRRHSSRAAAETRVQALRRRLAVVGDELSPRERLVFGAMLARATEQAAGLELGHASARDQLVAARVARQSGAPVGQTLRHVVERRRSENTRASATASQIRHIGRYRGARRARGCERRPASRSARRPVGSRAGPDDGPGGDDEPAGPAPPHARRQNIGGVAR
jgi:hypothetical protein